MSLAVHIHSRLLAGGFSKTPDLASLLVEPVPVVLNPVLVLDFHVLSVGVGHRFCGQPFDVLVVVHEQWHRANPPFL